MAAGIDFRLPLSGTSTHKSINPFMLKIYTSSNPSPTGISYDGSSEVILDLVGITVDAASAFATPRNIKVIGGAISASGANFDGSADIEIPVTELDAAYMTKNQLAVANGGTGKASWTANGLLYASASTTLGQIAVGTADQVLVSNGAQAAPGWVNQSSLAAGTADALSAAVSLLVNLTSTTAASFTTSGTYNPGVTGTLSIANGGTNKSTWTHNRLVCVDNSGALDVLAAGVTNQVLISGGTTGLASWTNQSNLAAGTASALAAAVNLQVSLSNTSPASFDGSTDVTTIGVDGTLAIGNGGTGHASWTANGIVYASSTSALSQITPTQAGQILVSGDNANNVTIPQWLGAGQVEQVLQSQGTALPQWVTPSITIGTQTKTAGGADSSFNINTILNDLGISQVFRYLGVSSTDPTTAVTLNNVLVTTFQRGDMVIYNGTSYFYNGTQWEGLNSGVGYKILQEIIADSDAQTSTAEFETCVVAVTQDRNGVITVTKGQLSNSTVYRASFTIANGTSSKEISKNKFKVDSQVLSINVTSGEANLPSPISWTSAAGKITLTTTSNVSGDVSGYILVARGVDLG